MCFFIKRYLLPNSEFPVVLQEGNMDCGIACLRSIGLYFGKDIPQNYLINLCENSNNGISMYALSEVADKVGFQAHALKVDFQILENEISLPVIAYLTQKHYTVIHKIDSEYVYASDPSLGLGMYFRHQFLIEWIGKHASFQTKEGILLLLVPKI